MVWHPEFEDDFRPETSEEAGGVHFEDRLVAREGAAFSVLLAHRTRCSEGNYPVEVDGGGRAILR